MSRSEPPLADPAPRIARARSRLTMVRRLAEIGMMIAEALAADAPRAALASSRRDPLEVFCRLSRAVRLALVLEQRIENGLVALRPKVIAPTVGELEFCLPSPPPPPSNHFRNRVHDRLYLMAYGLTPDEAQARATVLNLETRLLDGAHYDAFLDLPFEAAVRAIGQDLGLDYDRWAAAIAKTEDRERCDDDESPFGSVPDPTDWDPSPEAAAARRRQSAGEAQITR
jgi:hypothetical protein